MHDGLKSPKWRYSTRVWLTVLHQGFGEFRTALIVAMLPTLSAVLAQLRRTDGRGGLDQIQTQPLGDRFQRRPAEVSAVSIGIAMTTARNGSG